ncbi:translation machinery-associated protein 20 [Entomophthora muscae]|uniref:Translation machinery-associated protein 20 n=1 Tax=Entomophthora muscae TaxID=34485 RepID=A0ACC2SS98_9FUNG|nr:translation machinery-associated protein 20 [Entomophthora muscae]
MFKKFNPKEDISGHSQLKSSVQRNIRAKIAEQYPSIEGNLEDILPKKSPIILQKYSQEHVNFITVNNVPLFFNNYDGPYFPTLRLLHQYPDMLPSVQVDRGAIKFVLAGANIMCPGLTSAGARLDTDLPAQVPVAIKAEGKEHPLAIGLTLMSTDDIKKINKGHGVENVHFLNDSLWNAQFDG